MSNWRKGARELKIYLKRTWYVAAPYWRSEHKKMAWTLLLARLSLLGAVLYVNSILSYATADLFNAMEARNLDQIWLQLGIFSGLWTILISLMVLIVHFENLLIIHWRRFMTERYLGDYLRDNIFSQLELGDYDLDNPDQRIAMDLFNLAKDSLGLFLGILNSVGGVVVYGVILWRVSGALEFQVAGYDVVIPGYMFWVAVIYVGFGTWLTHRLAAPMTRLNFERQAAEADFRYQLVRLRENAEPIALLKGEKREMATLIDRFGAIWDNWMSLLRYKKRLQGIQFGQRQFTMFFPYIIAMPAFMAGTIQIGGVMQLRGVFIGVAYSMSWFINVYDALAEWKSSVDRVISMENAFRAAQKDRNECRIDRRSGTKPAFEIANLNVDLPNGESLLRNVQLSLLAGQNVVVTGASGSGKSTFFKVLSSQWLWGEGEVTRPAGKVMFIPQKPYLPIDSLRNVLTYPNPADVVDDTRLCDVMRLCLLEKFVDKLDEAGDWSRVLSGGEQQRLSFVRAILAQPDWLFLDEATAALDPVAEAAVYSALKSELPQTTLVSIAHRESIRKYHDRQLIIDPATRSMSLIELQPA